MVALIKSDQKIKVELGSRKLLLIKINQLKKISIFISRI